MANKRSTSNATGKKNSLSDRWEKNFALLEQFVADHDRLPKMREQYHGVNIGKWCDRQKQAMLNHACPEERLQKLQNLDLFNTTLYALWNKNFSLLEEFVAEYHHIPKENDRFRGANIGRWCHTQKHAAKHPDYPADRFRKLQEIGLFDPTSVAQWNQNFALLEQFVADYDRLPKMHEKYHNKNLGRWCNNQKEAAKKPNYPTERRQKLQAIGLLVAPKTRN